MSKPKKCKKCKGSGTVSAGHCNVTCPDCEGLGTPLVSLSEENFNDVAAFEGVKKYPDDDGYLDIEEEDYEI